MRYKAIISDVDGTLTVSHPKALPNQRVKQAIKKTKKHGLIFSIASARPYEFIDYLIDELALSSPLILNNGALIFDPIKKAPLWESTVAKKDAEKFIALTKHLPKKYHIDTNIGVLVNTTAFPNNTKIYKALAIGVDPKKADGIKNILQKQFPHLSISIGLSYTGNGLFDIYAANAEATKQHAVLKFAEILGISTKEIIAIGDHYNDFPLFMACGLKVAMGNAVDDLKAIADYIAPPVEEDGVAHVIEKFILNNNP